MPPASNLVPTKTPAPIDLVPTIPTMPPASDSVPMTPTPVDSVPTMPSASTVDSVPTIPLVSTLLLLIWFILRLILVFFYKDLSRKLSYMKNTIFNIVLGTPPRTDSNVLKPPATEKETGKPSVTDVATTTAPPDLYAVKPPGI